jgi:hypothetical protein
MYLDSPYISESCIKKLGFMILLLAAFSLFSERRVSGDESETSECIICHTSAKMLIEATREIGPPTSEKVESVGEG